MRPSDFKVFNYVSRCSSLTAVYICLQVVLMCTTPGNATDFMFPDNVTHAIGNGKPKCQNNDSRTICTKIENYPSEQMERLILADPNRYMELFGRDFVIDVGTRFDAPGEESLCTSIERLVFPQTAPNIANQWRVIVNQGKYEQGIRIEECMNVGASCYMSQHFPNSYNTECRQEYIFRQLLAISDGKLVKDQFRLPSSCKCILKTGM